MAYEWRLFWVGDGGIPAADRPQDAGRLDVHSPDLHLAHRAADLVAGEAITLVSSNRP